MGSLVVLGRAFFIFVKYQSSMSICVKSRLFLIETARSIKVTPTGNITKWNNCGASCQGVEPPLRTSFMGPTWAHLGPTGPRWAPCWPHELCCLGLIVYVPMENFTPCKGIHIHQKETGGIGFILKYGGQLHLSRCPTVSITSKDFTRFQIIW